ncbi:MAG TPA: hypothetical protein VF790_03420 [Dissulfurispiraceae bacterium]
MERFRAEIESLIGRIECPKGFSCCGTGFEHLCKAEDIGLAGSIVCLEERSHALRECKFSVPFGDAHFCNCSLRIYIARRFKK